jgi:hypothetical protein
MLISNKVKFAVTAAAIVASTSSAFAIDPARERQLGQTDLNTSQQYTAYHDVRTRLCPLVKWKEDRTVASVLACELNQKPL